DQRHRGTGGGRVQEAASGAVAQFPVADQRARQQRCRGPAVDDGEGCCQQGTGGQDEPAGQAPARLGYDRDPITNVMTEAVKAAAAGPCKQRPAVRVITEVAAAVTAEPAAKTASGNRRGAEVVAIRP